MVYIIVGNMHLPVVPILKQLDEAERAVIRKYGFSEKPDCAISCLRMVLSVYKAEVTLEEVDAFARRDGNGIFSSEMARFAQTRGFPATCYGYNLYLSEPDTDSKLTQSALLSKFKDELSHPWFDKEGYQAGTESLIQAMESGVNYIIERPNFEIIQQALKSGIPPIVTVNPSALYRRQDSNLYAAHDVAVTGVDGDQVYFVDPNLPEEQQTDPESLMFAILSRKVIVHPTYMVLISALSQS